MNSAKQQNDLIFLLGGIALLVSGLIFLGANFGIYSLDSHFSRGILALLAGFGFLAGTRFQSSTEMGLDPGGILL